MTLSATVKTETVSLRDYQEWTLSTAIYPDAGKGTLPELMYCALGLSGEAGEVANYVKKLQRDGDSAELRAAVAKELGDVMWYAARMASALGIDLQQTISDNKAKLESRKARGAIGGSGDNR
jgi:NTP pyrophosphatase (non-canonical NTP hydrolase)